MQCIIIALQLCSVSACTPAKSIIKLGLPSGPLLLGSIGLRHDRWGGDLDELRVHVDRIAVDDLAKSVELLHDVLLGHGCRRQGSAHRFVNAQEGSRKL